MFRSLALLGVAALTVATVALVSRPKILRKVGPARTDARGSRAALDRALSRPNALFFHAQFSLN